MDDRSYGRQSVKEAHDMKTPLRLQCSEFRPVFMCLISGVLLLLTVSTLGLGMFSGAAAR